MSCAGSDTIPRSLDFNPAPPDARARLLVLSGGGWMGRFKQDYKVHKSGNSDPMSQKKSNPDRVRTSASVALAPRLFVCLAQQPTTTTDPTNLQWRARSHAEGRGDRRGRTSTRRSRASSPSSKRAPPSTRFARSCRKKSAWPTSIQMPPQTCA